MARTKSINFPNTRDEMIELFDKLQRAVTCVNLVAGGVGIKTGSGSPTAAFADPLYYVVDGVPCTLAAADCAALSGTVTNAKFNVFVFTVEADGTLHTRMGTEAASLAAVTWPTIPDGEVVFGFVIVNPTGTGNFVGGTTDLDDATVVPNAKFADVNSVFAPFCNPL